ncbi:MAG: hypothetical protein IPH17_00115 [Bacteroidales bacterium]|nr:hypothetical protein [Bacteroidales bacterium]
MKPNKTTSFLFYYFVIIYFIYVALNSILFAKQSSPTYIVNGFFLLFTIYITFQYVEIKRFMIPMYLFFIYLLILIFFSSNFFYSAQTYIKTLIPALFLPISFTFIKDINQLKKFNKILILFLLLYLINFILTNFFKIGKTPYSSLGSDFSLYVGNVFTEGLNSIAYILVILPLILYLDKKNKKIVIILGVLALIALLLNLKRISIIAVLIGYFFLILFSKRKSYFIKSIVPIILLLFILYPFYKEPLQYQYMNRASRFTEDFYETEGRYIETKLVWDEVFSFNSIQHSLFGKEMFNSSGKYGGGIFRERYLHVDYNSLLFGAGIFGLLFYFYYNVIILKYFLRLKKKFQYKDNTINMMNATFIAVFLMSFIISFSGSFGLVIFTSIRSIYLGAILGIYNNCIYINKKPLND